MYVASCLAAIRSELSQVDILWYYAIWQYGDTRQMPK